MRCDVLVVGGGPAGIAAAITAARAGANTHLVERNPQLGGNVTAALVHTICGLYHIREKPGAEYAHEGFPKEIAERLLAIGGAAPPVRMGRLDVLPTKPAAFAQLATTLTAETKNLTTHLSRGVRPFIGSEITRSWISGDVILEPTVVIDTTGEANLARESADLAPTRQRPAIIFTLADAVPLTPNLRLQIANHLRRVAPGAALRESVGETYVTIDLPHEDFDQALDLTARVVSHLRTLPGFERATRKTLSTQLGVRESHLVRGRYQLTADDILTGATFPDAVAVSTWPIELRETIRGPKFRYPTGPCQIPARALRSATVPNLLTAGRCLSATHEAQAALRVIGTALATGEAAGRLAAQGV